MGAGDACARCRRKAERSGRLGRLASRTGVLKPSQGHLKVTQGPGLTDNRVPAVGKVPGAGFADSNQEQT